VTDYSQKSCEDEQSSVFSKRKIKVLEKRIAMSKAKIKRAKKNVRRKKEAPEKRNLSWLVVVFVTLSGA